MREELIEKVSKLYRSQLDYVNSLKLEIADLKEQIYIGNKSLPHNEYKKLERRLKMTESEYEIEVYVAKGMFLAREELLE